MRKNLLIFLLCLILTTSASGQSFAPNQKPMLGLQINWAHPLSRGLVGYWPFNEGSGNIVQDLSGNGNHGTITTASWVGGKFGSALDFSGGGTIATGKSFSNRGLTFVCWARNSTPDDGAVFGEVGGGPYEKLLLMTNRSAKISVYLGDGTNYNAVQSAALGVGAFAGWHQYAWTIPAITTDNIIIYHDGIEVASGVIDYSTTFTASLVPTVFNPFDEYLDHALFYNRVLSISEIALLYREPFCMFVEDDIALMEAAIPTVGGQVIIISKAVVPFILVISIILIKRRQAA